MNELGHSKVPFVFHGDADASTNSLDSQEGYADRPGQCVIVWDAGGCYDETIRIVSFVKPLLHIEMEEARASRGRFPLPNLEKGTCLQMKRSSSSTPS